jgi:hypothetical protein
MPKLNSGSRFRNRFGTSIAGTFILMPRWVGRDIAFTHADTFANAVWKNVICARRLRPSYLIGPKVAVLPWLHRLLPGQRLENLWASRFRKRPHA